MIALYSVGLLITLSEIKQLSLQRLHSLHQDYLDGLSTVINFRHQIVKINEGESFVAWQILLFYY